MFLTQCVGFQLNTVPSHPQSKQSQVPSSPPVTLHHLYKVTASTSSLPSASLHRVTAHVSENPKGTWNPGPLELWKDKAPHGCVYYLSQFDCYKLFFKKERKLAPNLFCYSTLPPGGWTPTLHLPFSLFKELILYCAVKAAILYIRCLHPVGDNHCLPRY